MVDAGARFQVNAHRGASATHPENTLAAFEAAVHLGVFGIELDIRGTVDGVPVVTHDGSLRRTHGIDRSIADLTFEELRSSAPSVPSFAEVLHLVDGRCHLDVEIKAPGVEETVLNMLGALPNDRWAISSFDWDILREIRGHDERAELWVLCLAVSTGALETADGLAATTLAVQHSAITPDVVEHVSELGRRVMAWTVNDPARALDLVRCGVNGICTDDPATIHSALIAR